ncbi:MurR/RpiR family transcriptional regulator [uncultured Catenibacterium sp.]|uniref:MurR/RpiR family transcriptional regulator n=1 Tax=uncultured Catenibacterium sp. TaxID=286142 RepID=UPI0025D966BD|nr:MurR/RpiR family transcriptional regulator [uncultured Catenibacterium sp.]
MEFTYSQVESLNETETYVYNYVVKNTKKVLNESIRELANNTHVSTATVMRFCKKMGCEGFTELKYRLKESEEVQERETSDYDDCFNVYMDYVRSSEYLETIERCADMIKHADTFSVLGIGVNSDIAKYTAQSFSRVGYYCYGIGDVNYPLLDFSSGKKSVIVVIYQKTQKKVLFEEVCKCKNMHHSVIVVTYEDVGALAQLCDEVLYVSKGSVNIGSIRSCIPILYAMERLIYELTK